MLHVLVVGGGGREHALAWKLAQSPRVGQISVAPGNAGTAAFARNVPIDATDVVSLIEFAEAEGVDLTVVGPEEPLASGLVDQFEAAGLRIFGPRRQAALIETSKSYAKGLMKRCGVPTPYYEVVTTLEQAREFADASRGPHRDQGRRAGTRQGRLFAAGRDGRRGHPALAARTGCAGGGRSLRGDRGAPRRG